VEDTVCIGNWKIVVSIKHSFSHFVALEIYKTVSSGGVVTVFYDFNTYLTADAFEKVY